MSVEYESMDFYYEYTALENTMFQEGGLWRCEGLSKSDSSMETRLQEGGPGAKSDSTSDPAPSSSSSSSAGVMTSRPRWCSKAKVT